jgi:hypothetical protein
MFTAESRHYFRRNWKTALTRPALLALYLLMTVQFVGCYLFLVHPYIDFNRFAHGYERLPFQTRLLLAPLFGWAQQSAFMVGYADRLSRNGYFFPRGVGPGGILELYLNIPCVLIAGWATVRIYQAATRRRLLGWLVYPLFLVLCAVTYILHMVQNFRFVYDMPSLMFFSLGLYLIYFRKPTLLLVALFAVATLNRETALFLIPFYVLSECLRSWNEQAALAGPSASIENRLPRRNAPLPPKPRFKVLVFLPVDPACRHVRWQRILKPEVAVAAGLMLAYWVVWHVFIFHLFRNNVSEYYSRIPFNLHCLGRLRYYPQIFSAGGYLLPFLMLYRKHIHDAQLRLWLWMIPAWCAIMMTWGILSETRIYGELLPLVACAAALIAEEALATAIERRHFAGNSDKQERVHLARAA